MTGAELVGLLDHSEVVLGVLSVHAAQDECGGRTEVGAYKACTVVFFGGVLSNKGSKGVCEDYDKKHGLCLFFVEVYSLVYSAMISELSRISSYLVAKAIKS